MFLSQIIFQNCFRVVTGVRFVKRNRILYLQIQEGKLLPYGMIDSATVKWVPVENYKIKNSSIFEGKDYHRLTWLDRRLDLQTIMAQKGSVVTGKVHMVRHKVFEEQ